MHGWIRAFIGGLGAAFLCAVPALTTANTTSHISMIGLITDSGLSRAFTDSDINHTVYVGFVGVPIKAHITYSIGWNTYADQGGQAISSASDIKDPEYGYFCATSAPCNLSAYGIRYNVDTGIFTGTPTQPFQMSILPGVRDKTANGKQPWNGQGFWWTTFLRDSSTGYVWSAADSNPTKGQVVTILIITKPDPQKQVHLRCTINPGGDLFMNLDYDVGYVEVLGNAGSLQGFFKIDPSATILGWAGYPYSGVTLDRSSGALSATLVNPVNGVSQVSGQCVKRADTLSF
jgi:hypothetical protein